MTKLTRLTAKIFGETADATGNNPTIGQFGSGKAGTYVGTADVTTIQSLPAWSNGWIDAVTPTQQFPALPEMTGVHKVLSYQNAYLLQQGIAEWDSSTTYYENNFCAKDGKIYFSKTDSNLNNNPTTDTVNWEEFKSDKADIDLSNVNNTGTSTGASWITLSNTYTSFTWGASGTEYTAPATGYFVIWGAPRDNNGYIQVYIKGTGIRSWTRTPTGNINCWLAPLLVQKNDIVILDYSVMSTTSTDRGIRFYYATGTVWEA